jgi:hypothetical protein
MPQRWTTFFAAVVLVVATAAVGTVQQEFIEALRAKAEQGDAEAQYNLGLMYANGDGVPQDDAEAVRWLRLAADQGLSQAQFNLGVAYRFGRGVPQDDAEAARWYRLAADQGFDRAQYNLGVQYRDGQGVAQDDVEAVRWFRLAADQGFDRAQYNLGLMYEFDRGVPQDEVEATRLYRLAAEQGNAYAQFRLGLISQSDAEKAGWYRLAAEQGFAPAQYLLGFMYINGGGVLQDDAEAGRWFRLAAEQGDAGAQFEVGLMYGLGRSVPQDDVLAYMWFNLASVNATGVPQTQEEAVRARDVTYGRMTPAQRAEGQRLAREWTPRVTPEPGAVSPEFEDVNPSEFRGATGTAFIVDPNGVLLTAHHVIDQATSITVSCNGRPVVPVTVTSSSPTIDLAVLTATSDLGTETFLRLAPAQQSAIGDEVFTVGYPLPSLLGRDAKYTDGTISALSGIAGDASFLQISVPIQPGNSGGPLVNQNGEVVGIVVATADAPTFIEAAGVIPQNINWAVKSVFASALFTPPTARTGAGVNLADVTDATCLVEATGAAQ